MVRVLSFMKLRVLFTHTFVLLRRLLHIHYRNSLAAAVLLATLLGFMYLQLLICGPGETAMSSTLKCPHCIKVGPYKHLKRNS